MDRYRRLPPTEGYLRDRRGGEAIEEDSVEGHIMGEDIKDLDQDVEGHSARRATDEDDVEGHGLRKATDEDDVEGHTIKKL